MVSQGSLRHGRVAWQFPLAILLALSLVVPSILAPMAPAYASRPSLRGAEDGTTLATRGRSTSITTDTGAVESGNTLPSGGLDDFIDPAAGIPAIPAGSVSARDTLADLSAVPDTSFGAGFAPTNAALTTLVHTFPAGWGLVAVPLQPADPTPTVVFADVPSPLYLYAYQDGLMPGLEEPGFPAVTPGLAYWLLLAEGTTVAVSGDLVSTAADFSVPISPGWNAIATPWPGALDWADSRVSVSDGTTTHLLGDAITGGWIAGELFAYDAGAYSPLAPNTVPPDQMLPWRGYLLFSNIDGELIFSPPPPDTTPPTVAFDSPAENADLMGLVDILGTASDDNLVQYTLEYAAVDSSDFTTFATGSEAVVNGTLGTLDTTLMLNGLTRLRLTATDLGGNSASVTRTVQLLGGNKPGIFTITFADLTVPVAGVPITVLRTYDSRVKTREDFGVGWMLDIRQGSYRNNRVPGEGWTILPGGGFPALPCQEVNELLPHLTEVRLSDREYYNFSLTLFNTMAVSGGCAADAEFEFVDGSMPGATLGIIGNTGVIYRIGSNEVLDDSALETYNPIEVRLTTIDGRIFDLERPPGGITRIEDPNGNALFIGVDGIVHSSGKSVSFTRDAQGRITLITDPMGHALEYAYDANGDLVTFTDQAGNLTEFIYDSRHNLLEIHDPLGNRAVTSEYDAAGRLIAMTDAKGIRVEFTHDIEGQEEIVRDSRGNLTRYLYDQQGNVLQQEQTVTIEGAAVLAVTTFEYDSRDNETAKTDPDGKRAEATYDGNDNLLRQAIDPGGLNLVTEFTYNTPGEMLTHTDPGGNGTSFTYDAAGNMTQFVDAVGNAHHFDYGAQGRATRREDPLGNAATLTYDASGYLTREEAFDASGNLVRQREFTYDANGNRLTETVFRTIGGTVQGLTTTFEYDEMNRLVAATDPLGNVSRIEYNAIGKESARIDALGRRTSYEYDEVGALVKATFPDGTFETIEYDSAGNVTGRTDRAGRVTTYEYDEMNRLVKTTFPDGSSHQTVYSPGGRVVAEIDGKGNRTDFQYDAAGRLVRTVHPEVFDVVGGVFLRPETLQEYNAAGNRTAVVDANGSRTEFVYDQAGRPTRTVYPDGSVSERHYDALSRIVEEVDEEGRVTTFEYDALGRLISVALPEPAPGEPRPVTTYTYDEAGNQLTQTDALGHTTRFSYDELNRLVERVLPGGESETHFYDAVGNRTAYTDFNGNTTTFQYDDLNRLTRKTFPDGSTVQFAYTATGQRSSVTDSGGTTTYAYDPLHWLASVTHPGGEAVSYTYDSTGDFLSVTSPGGVVEYEYDALSRLTRVVAPAGDTSYGYDAAGNRRSMTAANGIVTEYGLDARDRLTLLTHRTGGGMTLGSFAYDVPPSGLRTRVSEADGSTVDYTYDGLGRLTREVRTGSSPYDITYEYDAVGNRTRMVRDGVETLYTYDDNDRLLSAGGVTYEYDSNGNTIRKVDGTTVLTYAYDTENRLTSVTDGTETTTFTYDVDGNRVSSSSPSGVVNYLVDTQSNTGFSQVLEERDGGGGLMAFYSYGDDLVSMDRGGATSFYHYDGQMSTRLLTDASGLATDGYTYDAFGNLTGATGPTSNPYLYTGEQLDPNLGLYYLRARYYDPALGRFMTRDPFGGFPPDPISLQKYLYAGACPVNRIDPGGEWSLPEIQVVQTIQKTLRATSAPRFISKLCRIKSFAQNFFVAQQVVQAVGAVALFLDRPMVTNVGLDLDQMAKTGSGKQALTPTLFQFVIQHPMHMWPEMVKVTGEDSLRYLTFKVFAPPPKYERWMEVSLETFAGSVVQTQFSVHSPKRFMETLQGKVGKTILERSLKTCGMPLFTFSLGVEAGSASGGSISLINKLNVAQLLEVSFVLVKGQVGKGFELGEGLWWLPGVFGH